QGVTAGGVLVGVNQADAADGAAALQGVGRRTPYQAAAADDADLHSLMLPLSQPAQTALIGLGGLSWNRSLPRAALSVSAGFLSRRFRTPMQFATVAKLTKPQMPHTAYSTAGKLPSQEWLRMMGVLPTAAPPMASGTNTAMSPAAQKRARSAW